MKNNNQTFTPDQKKPDQQQPTNQNKNDQFKPGQTEKGSDRSHQQTDKSAPPKRGF